MLGDLSGVEVVIGDIADVPAFAPALDGCDTLFHTAAYFREYYRPGDHWATLERLNVGATMQLIQECERRGVPRMVHTSSSGVIGARDKRRRRRLCAGTDRRAQPLLQEQGRG